VLAGRSGLQLPGLPASQRGSKNRVFTQRDLIKYRSQNSDAATSKADLTFDLAGAEAGPAIAAVCQKVGDFMDTGRTFNRWWHDVVGT
jgi:hypothetical protein